HRRRGDPNALSECARSAAATVGPRLDTATAVARATRLQVEPDAGQLCARDLPRLDRRRGRRRAPRPGPAGARPEGVRRRAAAVPRLLGKEQGEMRRGSCHLPQMALPQLLLGARIRVQNNRRRRVDDSKPAVDQREEGVMLLHAPDPRARAETLVEAGPARVDAPPDGEVGSLADAAEARALEPVRHAAVEHEPPGAAEDRARSLLVARPTGVERTGLELE